MDTISESLKGIKFRGFEGIDIPVMLRMVSEADRIAGNPYSAVCKSILKLLLKTVLQKKYEIKKTPDAKLCLAFLSSTDRRDIIRIFNDLLGLNPGFDYILLLRKYTVSPGFFLRSAPNLLSWAVALRKSRLSLCRKITVMNSLLTVSFLRYCLRDFDPSAYHLLTVFFDAEPSHNFLVQLFRRSGVTTSTLQHGIILAPRKGLEKNMDFSGLELCGSISDLFLAWNTFTGREAVKAGVDEARVRVVGVSKCLSVERVLEGRGKKNVFGVLLDGKFTEDNNCGLIRFANDFARQSGMKYVLRYHPNFHGSEYEKNADSRFCTGNSNRTDKITDYADEVDFSIGVNSTAVIELIYAGYDVYLYAPGKPTDKYRDVHVPKIRTPEDLESMILTAEAKNAVRRQYFTELCTIEDIRSSYLSFFLRYAYPSDGY